METLCVGGVSTSSLRVKLAGQPLPPLSRDYGFSYVIREREQKSWSLDENHQIISKVFNTPALREIDSHDSPVSDADEDDDEDIHHGNAPTPSMSGRGRGRRAIQVPTPRSCISCGATKTPYWREAWSSIVLLCNACGLRYSKFRRRCMDCSYVPRKEDKGSKCCTKCGGLWTWISSYVECGILD